ncbi:MAG: 16S rRNA (cytosine(1402)-N(4))-methyltransferase RsmH [bacterium]|nr:16S rRNA (cytosine(1402)-N(4))-methyltransferase RsmH [bacterium]
MHIPVLLKEVISFLEPKPGEFFIDGTANGGGHARAILARIKSGTFLGCEWDREIFRNLRALHLEDKYDARIILKNENYARIPQILRKEKLPKADGLLLDLGFSSLQLEAGYGLSFGANHSQDPLDMRYDKNPKRKTAAEILNSFSRDELTGIFSDLGEERYARKTATEIVTARRQKKILAVGDLVSVIKSSVGDGYERGRIHPATRVFQALRIYVNDELKNLQSLLAGFSKILKPGGRVAIISFHSLEDRIVKNEFRKLKQKKMMTLLTKKPIISGAEEVFNNPRARSAKLRVARMN